MIERSVVGYGRVETVYDRTAGSQVGATVTGDGLITVISVDSTYDFAESPGGSFQHLESGLIYTYVDKDETLGTITLSSGLPVGVIFTEGDTLVIQPQGSTRWANVRMDDVAEETAIEMRVSQSIRAFLAPGTRDGLTDGEVAEITQIGPDEFIVSDIVGDDPLLQAPADLGVIQQGSLGTDGYVPGQVTGVSTTPGKGFIVVRWNPVLLNSAGDAQSDFVSFKVFVSSTPGFTAGTTNLVAETPGTMVLVRTLGDQTPLQYLDSNGAIQPYYFQVLGVDDDGEGLPSVEVAGSMSQTGTDDIVVGAITAGLLESVMLLSTTISTRAQDANGDLVGPGITLAPDSLVAYDSNGNATLEVRPDSSPAAVFRGDAEIDHLTVQTLTTLQQTLLSQGSKLTMQKGVSAPTNPPTATISWQNMALTPSGVTSWSAVHGFALTEDKSSWLTFDENAFNIRRHTRATGALVQTSAAYNSAATNVQITYIPVGLGSTFSAGYIWMVRQVGTAWQLLRIDPTTLATAGSVIDITADMNPAGRCAIGYDTTTGQIMVAYLDKSFHHLMVNWYTATGSSSVTNASFWDSGTGTTFTESSNLGAIMYGQFDFDKPYFVMKNMGATTFSKDPQFFVIDPTTHARNTGLEWDYSSSSQQIAGLVWDGFNFQALFDDGVVKTYEAGNTWTAAADNKWYAAYTWTAPGTETTLSNVVSFTMKKRARVTISTAPQPSGVTGVNIYLSKGATAPSKTVLSMTLQGPSTTTPFYPSRLISAAAFTPLNNPVAGTFGTGTPASITSDDGTSLVLQADGSWTLAGVGSHVSGGTTDTVYDTGWQTWSFGNGDVPFAGSVNYAQWRRIGPVVYVRVNRQINASYTPGGTSGNYANLNINDISSGSLPSNIRPAQQVICTARFDDSYAVVVLTTAGNFLLTGGTPGRSYASGNTIQWNAQWPLL